MLSSITRPKVKQFMRDYQFDLLVIGGGITGAGIALDALVIGDDFRLVGYGDGHCDMPFFCLDFRLAEHAIIARKPLDFQPACASCAGAEAATRRAGES